jgi:hypothetical protein
MSNDRATAVLSHTPRLRPLFNCACRVRGDKKGGGVRRCRTAAPSLADDRTASATHRDATCRIARAPAPPSRRTMPPLSSGGPRRTSGRASARAVAYVHPSATRRAVERRGGPSRHRVRRSRPLAPPRTGRDDFYCYGGPRDPSWRRLRVNGHCKEVGRCQSKRVGPSSGRGAAKKPENTPRLCIHNGRRADAYRRKGTIAFARSHTRCAGGDSRSSSADPVRPEGRDLGAQNPTAIRGADAHRNRRSLERASEIRGFLGLGPGIFISI